MSEPTIIECGDLDTAINEYKALGFRLDMIFPADNPREALMSKSSANVRIMSEPPALAGGQQVPEHSTSGHQFDVSNATSPPPAYAGGSDFVRGRAGMEYRDLIPDRMGGKVIASHIRLTNGGEVPDYVHYHKVDFQMIYCKRGRIKVVYEDQGGPFWLETGDCVLQPPEIRHRVLECTAGAEVIEVSMPAQHETWVEHEITLPTSTINAARDFGGQRFFRHIAANLEWIPSNAGGLLIKDTGILVASNGIADVWNLRLATDGKTRPYTGGMYAGPFLLYFILQGELTLRQGQAVLDKDDKDDIQHKVGDSFIITPLTLYGLDCSADIELLRVVITRWNR